MTTTTAIFPRYNTIIKSRYEQNICTENVISKIQVVRISITPYYMFEIQTIRKIFAKFTLEIRTSLSFNQIQIIIIENTLYVVLFSIIFHLLINYTVKLGKFHNWLRIHRLLVHFNIMEFSNIGIAISNGYYFDELP